MASVQQVCEAERGRDEEIESTPHTFRGMSRLELLGLIWLLSCPTAALTHLMVRF